MSDICMNLFFEGGSCVYQKKMFNYKQK